MLASSALAIAGTSCGQTRDDPPATAAHKTQAAGVLGEAEGHQFLKSDGDGDTDDSSKAISTDDEGELLHTKRATTTVDRAAIGKVVKAYYSAASAGDGATGCSLLSNVLSSSLAPSRHSGTRTCAQALTQLFALQRPHLAAEDTATLVLTSVRVHTDMAFVTLGFRSAPEAEMILRREAGAWKLNALFDSAMP